MILKGRPLRFMHLSTYTCMLTLMFINWCIPVFHSIMLQVYSCTFLPISTNLVPFFNETSRPFPMYHCLLPRQVSSGAGDVMPAWTTAVRVRPSLYWRRLNVYCMSVVRLVLCPRVTIVLAEQQGENTCTRCHSLAQPLHPRLHD